MDFVENSTTLVAFFFIAITVANEPNLGSKQGTKVDTVRAERNRVALSVDSPRFFATMGCI